LLVFLCRVCFLCFGALFVVCPEASWSIESIVVLGCNVGVCTSEVIDSESSGAVELILEVQDHRGEVASVEDSFVVVARTPAISLSGACGQALVGECYFALAGDWSVDFGARAGLLSVARFSLVSLIVDRVFGLVLGLGGLFFGLVLGLGGLFFVDWFLNWFLN